MHYQKYRLIIPFLLPAILLYGIFVVWPYAQAIYVSLTSWRGVSGNKPFVGLDNYQRLWGDERFHEALTRNGQLLVVLPLVTIAIALTFAALFTQDSQQIRGAGFYRIVFFFPQIIPAVIVGILWSYIYTPNIGLLNGILRAIGLGDISTSWLTDPKTVLWAIVAVAIWSSIGFYMVIFLASMQSVPTSFYEAAILDGATRWTCRSPPLTSSSSSWSSPAAAPRRPPAAPRWPRSTSTTRRSTAVVGATPPPSVSCS